MIYRIVLFWLFGFALITTYNLGRETEALKTELIMAQHNYTCPMEN